MNPSISLAPQREGDDEPRQLISIEPTRLGGASKPHVDRSSLNLHTTSSELIMSTGYRTQTARNAHSAAHRRDIHQPLPS